MTEIAGEIIGGVDAHTDTHVAAALDRRGGLLGTKTFPTTPAGYRALRAWLEQFGPIALVGVESTGGYAAGLVRELPAAGIRIAEVNRPHAHTRRRRGKTDPIDAEQAARHALSGAAHVEPKATDGIVEAIRQLRLARDSAVKARSAALCQLSEMTVTAPDDLRQHLRTRKTTKGRATLCRRLRPRHQPPARARAGRQACAALDRSPRRRARPRDRPARRRARTADRHRGAAHHEPARGLHRPRRPAAHHRRPKHRTRAQRRRVRRALRRQPDPGLLETHEPPPAQLRRRPRRQPSGSPRPALTWKAPSRATSDSCLGSASRDGTLAAARSLSLRARTACALDAGDAVGSASMR
ncbi:IS110 family transposase [Candidatus Solirubrobacter pratensis]